jgi:hypothetical protein
MKRTKKEVKALFKQWDARLKEPFIDAEGIEHPGIVDIETPWDRAHNHLNKQIFNHTHRQEVHFAECGMAADSGKFESEYERTIFTKYAEGLSTREIETWLILSKMEPLSHVAISTKINFYLRRFQIKPIG